jgi:hypothetical protein
MALPVALAIAALVSACGGGDNPVTASTVAVIGDMPYGKSPTDTSQFNANPAFIAALNKDADTSLVLHVGDTHSGKEYCTEAYNLSIYQQWKAFTHPVVYTPGDNEWADCHKKKEGGGAYNTTTGAIDYVKDTAGNLVDYAGGDPVANLQLVRSIFFGSPAKTAIGGMAVHSQAQEFDAAHPSDGAFAENVWFEQSNVLFVTLNVPGGSNNGTDPWYGAPTMSPVQQQEVTTRTAATLRWMDKAFAQAKTSGAAGVVVQLQADMWDLDGVAATHIAAYKPYIDSLATNATAFAKPVLLLNGDSHIYRSDNPLVSGANCALESGTGTATTACTDDAYANQSNLPTGYNVPNFHRVVVHGSTAPTEWLKLTIDPAANAANGANAFGPFSWKRVQPS